jgi:protein-L-isoaspartate(D-aspartate) O-methyltransferase
MVQQQVIARGVRDERVIAAMRKVPRHRFVEPALALQSYDSDSLPIGSDQPISQPFIVAYMTERLLLQKQHRVLEIGTGSGYQTAILAELATEVCTIECHAHLQNRARRTLSSLGYLNVKYHVGDGSVGWPETRGNVMFDCIIVTAAGDEISPRLLEQLVENGRLIAPLGHEGKQELTLFIKHPRGIRRTRLITCDFVPLQTRT